MKRTLIVFECLILLYGVILLNCSENNPVKPGSPGLPRSLSKSEADLISSDNKFGFKLFNEIVNYDKDKNVFISPLSVGLALGMTYNGARGETQEAMKTTLELHDMDLQEVNEAYKSLIELFMNLDPKVQFQIANSIWYRDSFNVEQEFIDLNQTYFNAEVTSLDFNDPGAPDIINGWINTKTNGKIKEVIDTIDWQTVMFLINALYFKGTWTYEFDMENTHEDQFTLSDGTQKPCMMMIQEGGFDYYENGSFQAIDLPYGVGDYSMTVLMPRPDVNIDDFISMFNQADWGQWTDSFYKQNMKVYFPKFKLEYKLKLNDVLKALGMRNAFSTLADFGGINPDADLYISNVLHKTFVDVNEEGTEAAAATVVEITLTSAGFSLRFDRPFVFVIREKNSGTIMFMGKIVEPVL